MLYVCYKYFQLLVYQQLAEKCTTARTFDNAQHITLQHVHIKAS